MTDRKPWPDENIRASLEWARNEFKKSGELDKMSWNISPWPLVEQLLGEKGKLEKQIERLEDDLHDWSGA